MHLLPLQVLPQMCICHDCQAMAYCCLALAESKKADVYNVLRSHSSILKACRFS